MKLYRILFILITVFGCLSVSAQTVDELKTMITERNNNIKQLEEEIKSYQKEIEGLGKEADSLKNTLKGLDLSKKKLETDLAVTQAKIDNTNYEIKQLGFQIDDKSARIQDSRRVISHSLAAIAQNDSYSVVENLLSSESLASVWNGAEDLVNLQSSVQNRIGELRGIRTDLENNKKKTETKKAKLVSLQKDLANQKKVLAETVKEKNALLAATKNSETSYKQLLASREAQKKAFEKELFDYESALKIAIDPSSLPKTGSGVLSWPLRVVKITQEFGQTIYSKRLYVSGSHGGIDLAASIGTPVFAALSGIVTDTEAVKTKTGCQYGKFILIKHINGLSTVYGHLSNVNVVPGQKVSTGDVIGYSGNTGYSFGPHLHFGVYATQGVRVVDARNLGSASCAGIKTVAAPPNAYLDPMLYL